MLRLEKQSEKTALLIISGEIGPETISIPSGLDVLTVEIDSLGGDALGGLRVYNSIKNSDAKNKIAQIIMAMSAATLPMVACNSIQMTSGSLVMIHGISDYTAINRGNAEQIIRELNSLDDTYSKCYAEASKTPAETFKKMMLTDTFLNADDMLELGFNVEIVASGKTHLPSMQALKTTKKAANVPEMELTLELMKRFGF